MRIFRTGQGEADHWGTAVKMCSETLGHALDASGYTLGFVYVTPAFAPDLPSILTFLRETTRIPHWVGGVAYGVSAGDHEYHFGGAVVAMALDLPQDAFEVSAAGAEPSRADFVFALMHCLGDDPSVERALHALLRDDRCFSVGGELASDRSSRVMVAEQVIEKALSGVFFSGNVAVIAGMAQGCIPLGEPLTVTRSRETVLMELDDRPALDVLKECAGDLISRRLEQAAGFIHVALPIAGDDQAGYRVRPLTGIDPRRGWLATTDPLAAGTPVLLVRRDANSAQARMRAMLDDLRHRAGGRRILGGLYVSCAGRGPHMFGPGSREARMIRAVFPDVPLLGFYAGSQIFRDARHVYAGTLTLFLEETS